MPKYIAINSHKGIKVLEVSNIVYLKSSGRYTSIYLQNKTNTLVCKNLGYYDKLFQDNDFLRVHNSYIVNVAYLNNIVRDNGGQYCILSDNYIVPISNRRFSSVKEYLHY
ncbi:LytR/AlgR family response regulator transcription factor [Confluentibacter sediminis]|uniref:LytR/AlgR family response regulator transcription factor n=1 Tax=Confluentibacter sediminis TaxID=2219045 RepID=UPI000DAC6471|nr:LytTR family DNA-binding domain-containing protein [Confluentibacter sediminis]